MCDGQWSHRYMTALSNEQAFAELYFSKKAIKDVIGVTPQASPPSFLNTTRRLTGMALGG